MTGETTCTCRDHGTFITTDPECPIHGWAEMARRHRAARAPKCCPCGCKIELDPSGKFYRTNIAAPVAEGDCCDACNAFVVVPARAGEGRRHV